jgi:hypothetical protein
LTALAGSGTSSYNDMHFCATTFVARLTAAGVRASMIDIIRPIIISHLIGGAGT